MTKISRKASRRAYPVPMQNRLKHLRQRMAKDKLDAFLISYPQDIRYLTGFSGEDSWTLVTRTGVTILSDRRFEEELKSHYNYAPSVLRKKSLAEELAKLIRSKRVKKLGLQAEHLSLSGHKLIAKHVGASHLRQTKHILIEQRSIKDASELPPLCKAIEIQETAFKQLLGQIKPGMTEKHICALLEFNIKSLGGDGPSFTTIIGAGANSSIPHYRPGDVKWRAKSPLLIDFGALYGGYHSDMTRVVAAGGFPRKIAEIYKVVRDAQLAGIEAIKPGALLKDVDDAARKVIVKAGYGKQFGHSLGHGIGLEIHEEPRLAATSKGALEPGMIVTVEPGIYLPGVGGVRLEDDILVTPTGYKNLCSLPTDIKSAII